METSPNPIVLIATLLLVANVAGLAAVAHSNDTDVFTGICGHSGVVLLTCLASLGTETTRPRTVSRGETQLVVRFPEGSRSIQAGGRSSSDVAQLLAPGLDGGQ